MGTTFEKLTFTSGESYDFENIVTLSANYCVCCIM